MSWCRNMRIRCDGCGLFCTPHDEETPFGCSSYDPPEPLDPSHYCKKCSQILYKKWLKWFQDGKRYGYWQKSNAERKAAKECGLAWVASGGHGMLGSKDFADSYQYITQKEYDRLDKLPYYGYCKLCGEERKGGYCSDKKCKESFEKKMESYK